MRWHDRLQRKCAPGNLEIPGSRFQRAYDVQLPIGE
jgi:hypothetical protein